MSMITTDTPNRSDATVLTVQSSGRGRVRVAVAFLLALLSALTLMAATDAAGARADATEQSILMDDTEFIYSSPAAVEQNLRQVAGLGVNTIKVSVVWSLVAPDPASATAPADFDASDPADYPSANWERYDTLVRDADQLGLQVYFQITGPAPRWATDPTTSNSYQNSWSHDLNPGDFGQFVAAVARRYSGSYVGADGATVPAVDEWGLWNEPNEIGWISPQTVTVDHHRVAESPITYRKMFDLGYAALVDNGHGNDTILLGETASKGNVHELPFIQDLFCVDARNRPLTGQAARLADCPGHGAAFVRENPGLFTASGFATHPYGFTLAPDQTSKRAQWIITMAALPKLAATLDDVDRAYHQRTGMPIDVTEWGYKTNPPNPTLHTTPTEQANWIDEGWYMSAHMPRVRAMAQELLLDQPPVPGAVAGTPAYWGNFDSGLEFPDGTPKPAYAAFRLPLWVPVPETGRSVDVWADIRPAATAGNAYAVLQFQAAGSRTWTRLAAMRTENPDGFVSTRVAIRHPGAVRLSWYDPATDTIDDSRSVEIHPAPRPRPRHRPSGRHRPRS